MRESVHTSTVIAAVGMAGSGKSTAIEAIVRHWNCPSVYFGGEVLKEVARRGLPEGPESERSVRESLRAEHGATAVARLALPTLHERIQNQVPLVLIDGVYSWAEVEFLRSQLNCPLHLLAIHAPRALRATRMQGRPVRPLTPEQLDERDRSEIAQLDKATPLALADMHVVNDTDTLIFQQRVVELVTRSLPN